MAEHVKAGYIMNRPWRPTKCILNPVQEYADKDGACRFRMYPAFAYQ